MAFIDQLIAAHPAASRRGLSRKLCEAWNWVQPNGTPRDMVCRGLMLALHRAGHIELPPPRYVVRHAPSKRHTPAAVAINTAPLRGPLGAIRPLTFRQVRRTPDESLCNSLIEQYHYLGYTQPGGEGVDTLVVAHGRSVVQPDEASEVKALGEEAADLEGATMICSDRPDA